MSIERIFENEQFDTSHSNVQEYRAKIIQSGEYKELEIYPIFKRSYARGQKKKVTKFFQACVNENNSVKKLTRLLNANFNENSVWYDFTYTDKPTIEEATANIRNYIRRLKKRFGEFKYVYTTEQGETNSLRGHHHLICDIDPKFRNEVEKMWTKGERTRSRMLVPGENGFDQVAGYFAKQSKGVYRKYTTSHNLIKPSVQNKDGLIGKRAVEALTRNYEIGVEKIEKIKQLKNYKVTSFVTKQSEYVAGIYVYIKMRTRNNKKGGKEDDKTD